MPEYRRGAHTVFEIHLHLVWITKYRRAAMVGEVATRVRDLIRDICAQHEVQIMKGHVAKEACAFDGVDPAAGDHEPVAAMVEGPDGAPIVGGVSAFEEAVLGRHLWARGYFCCSSGNMTDEVIAKYIAEQNLDQDEDFRVDG